MVSDHHHDKRVNRIDTFTIAFSEKFLFGLFNKKKNFSFLFLVFLLFFLVGVIVFDPATFVLFFSKKKKGRQKTYSPSFVSFGITPVRYYRIS